MINQFLRRFSVYELIIIAFMAAIGIAVKPIIAGLAHLITGPLFIPSGVLAGGFYMMFIIVAGAIVAKPGAVTLVCIIQAFLVIVTGVYGNHGMASLVTYILPGLFVDILWLFLKHKGCCLLCCFLAGMVANITGSLSVNFVFFRLPTIPLLISLFVAAISGGMGGIIAYHISCSIRNMIEPKM